ncbi:MAG: pyruvate carboxyltransferase [Candidatus Roizmanbacteria bacterium]|nr:pyruvate carboxyltransferase [Candidatus Roizmanbacteria bacterium]
MSKIKLTNNFKGIIDTTFRDGQQSPLMFDTYKYRFSLEDKIILANGLMELGVDRFEFFSPVVSTIEREDFAKLSSYMRNKKSGIKLYAHCRCHPADIEAALESGFDGLNFYIGIADHSQKYSHGMDTKTIGKRVSSLIGEVRGTYPKLYIRFSAEDCFRTPLEDIYDLYDLVTPYVDTFGMPDTVGIATPTMVYDRVTALKKRYPMVDLECHFHNDRGYSLINATTAVLAGASYVDTSIWGMAERSGITSLTGLLFNLYQENPQLCNHYILNLCYPLNVLMGSILKCHVPYNEPISITNRTHTAGVHQKAVIKSNMVYEGVDLAIFGVSSKQLLLGPLTGWNLILYFLKEVENYDLTDLEAKEITKIFKSRTNEIGKGLTPKELLINTVDQYGLSKRIMPEKYIKKRIENLD